MPENESIDLRSETVTSEEAVDDAALIRLSTNPDFKVFIKIMETKARAARTNLDKRQTDDMQSIGFYRGQLWMLKLLYRMVMSEPQARAQQETIKQSKIQNGGR